MDTVDSRPRPPVDETPAAGRTRSDTGRLVLAGLSFLLAIAGQLYFKKMRSVVDGTAFFLLAVVAFALLVRQAEAALGRPAGGSSLSGRVGEWIRANRPRAALIAAGVVLALVALYQLTGRTGASSYWDIFALWVLSFLCYAAAFIRRPAALDARGWLAAHGAEVMLVLALTGVALFVRLTQLGATPGIISGDEGRLGTLAQSVQRGELNNMFSTVFGHSTIYIYLLAGVMDLFGWTPAMLRITSALGGALTVPVLYIFARRFFNVRVAFVAAALVTVSHIHVHFSRVVVAGGIQDALFATAALYFFLSGLEKRSPGRLVTSALIMGLHLYLYMGARLVIVLAPVYLLVLLLFNARLVRENLPGLAAFGGMLLVVGLPMGLWATTHYNDFMARMNQIGVVQSGWLAAESVKLGRPEWRILLDLFWQALLSINYYPAVAFYNAKIPMLDFLTGAVFVLGLAYSLLHLANHRHLLLQGWFWAGIVGGGALVVLPAISVYRILIVFPVVCLFVAIGFDRLVEFASEARPGAWAVTGLLTLAFVGGFSAINLRAYFVDYAPTCAYEDWSTRFASYMGENLGKAGADYRGYLVGNSAVWYGIHPSVDFLTNRNPITNVREPVTLETRFEAPAGKAMFFFTNERQGELSVVQRLMPGGETYQVLDCEQPIMTIYRVDNGTPGS